MPADARRLGRLLRVRAIQRDLAAADAARAADQVSSHAQMVIRIETLAEDVAPATGAANALDLAAAATYRRRLQASHADARQRLSTAEAFAERREDASREAQRDHRAIEKLAEQARSRAVLDEMRRLAEGPFGSRRGTKLADPG